VHWDKVAQQLILAKNAKPLTLLAQLTKLLLVTKLKFAIAFIMLFLALLQHLLVGLTMTILLTLAIQPLQIGDLTAPVVQILKNQRPLVNVIPTCFAITPLVSVQQVKHKDFVKVM